MKAFFFSFSFIVVVFCSTVTGILKSHIFCHLCQSSYDSCALADNSRTQGCLFKKQTKKSWLIVHVEKNKMVTEL